MTGRSEHGLQVTAYGCDETYERASKGAQHKGQWCACGHRAGYHDAVWITVKRECVPVGLGACSCPDCECGDYKPRAAAEGRET